MNRIAQWMARRIWWWLLWLTRRPWLRRLQERSIGVLPRSRQESARRSLVWQNRIARRYGLSIITLMMNLVIASLILTFAFEAVLTVHESGVLEMPDSLRERVSQQ